jgi:endonuclease/exonuclease/phosphatase family metal-dependent hydrolase
MRFKTLFLLLFSAALFGYQTAGTDSTLDITTWNIENFPKEGTTTVSGVNTIIGDLEVDLIGVEEITDSLTFMQMINSIGNYSAVLSPHRYSSGEYQKVGFVYRSDKLTLLSSSLLFSSDYYYFPRPPLQCRFSYNENGHSLEFTAIVLHLKALGDSESVSRRLEAMSRLKTYLDDQLSSGTETKFVVIGDYNDLADDETDNIFSSFISDTDDYTLLTLPLAGEDYSYPGWSPPSLLDHLLITKGMFSAYGNGITKVLHLENEDSRYLSDISDHLPVTGIFVFDGSGEQPDETMPIADLQNNFSAYEGLEVTVQGIVTVPAGKFAVSYTSVYIQDESSSGINLYSSSFIDGVFELGTEVKVSGTALTYKGLHEISLDSYEIISTGNPQPPYQWLYTGQLSSTSFQGMQALATGVITSISGGAVMIDDGSGEGKIYIDSDTGIDFSGFSVGDSITALGVMTVYNDEGELQPVFQKDIFKGLYTAINEPNHLPEKTGLIRSYPNPFNPTAKIEFRLARTGTAEIQVFNPLGQLVAKKRLGIMSGGLHTAVINGNLLGNSGVYFIRLLVNGQPLPGIQRIVYIK